MHGSIYYKSYYPGVPTPFYTVHARLNKYKKRSCSVVAMNIGFA